MKLLLAMGVRIASAGGNSRSKRCCMVILQADVASGDGLGPTGEGFIVQVGVQY